MADWRPYREPLHVTLARTLSIALVAGGVVALVRGNFQRWPAFSLLMLWPAFGGHWIDLFFLNVLRPRVPASRAIQRLVRLGVWFAGGTVLAAGVQLTARLLFDRSHVIWLTWATAGAAFVVIELVAHAALYVRGRPSFYNGLG
jgi:hypothetical protein